MNRRDFLRVAGKVALGASAVPFGGLTRIPSWLSSAKSGVAAGDSPGIPLLTLLYTNDTHARHEPFPETARLHRGLGGAVRRSNLIESIRAEGQPVLLLDAGDFFQGTPWFNAFEGRIEMEMLLALGYDAITLGNHEFDVGTAGFAKAAEGLKLPFVSSNLDFVGTPMKDLVRNTIVRKLPNGLRIGILGLSVDLKGLLPEELFKGVTVWDPVVRANVAAQVLRRDYKCDLVVCLSHLGYSYANDTISDLTLVPQTRGIDLVIGGHTHTAMDAPDVKKNSDGRPVLITQAGHSGIRLGRIDVYLSQMLNGEGPSSLVYRAQQIVVAEEPILLQETWVDVGA